MYICMVLRLAQLCLSVKVLLVYLKTYSRIVGYIGSDRLPKISQHFDIVNIFSIVLVLMVLDKQHFDC